MKGILERALIVGCDAKIAPDESCPRLLVLNTGADWPIEDQDRAIRAQGFGQLSGDRHMCPLHLEQYEREISRLLDAVQEVAQ